MAIDLVSLALISLVSVACPIIAGLIPGKPIPETVLLLLAGALLGPHGLGAIQSTDAINLLSDLGLAFLFLLAGYEISPKNLTGTEGKRGAATWAVTFAIAFVVVAIWPTLSAFELDGLAVVIALTTTAMGTLLPILQERGILGTRMGNEIIAYGTWGELLPIIAMALLLSTRATWQTVVILLAFLAIAVAAAAVPKIAERIGGYVHRFIVANANTNTQMVIRSVNLLLIGLTAVSAVFDLDIVLGAFAAGFILRYLIPTGDQTMEMKHNAIAYGFLVPLFFVVSGAKVDVRAIGAQPELLVLFILLLLFVRALPIFVGLSTGRESRTMDVRERLTVAFYCTTALPIIVAVTSVAVSADAMSQADRFRARGRRRRHRVPHAASGLRHGPFGERRAGRRAARDPRAAPRRGPHPGRAPPPRARTAPPAEGAPGRRRRTPRRYLRPHRALPRRRLQRSRFRRRRPLSR